MAFAVVEFPKEGTCQFVPVSWLTKQNKFCLYPNVSVLKISGLIKNKVVPPTDGSWHEHEVRLLVYAASYEEARQKAARAELTSNFEDNSDEELPRSKRRKLGLRYDSSDDESFESKFKITETRPELKSTKARKRRKVNPRQLFSQQRVSPKQPPGLLFSNAISKDLDQNQPSPIFTSDSSIIRNSALHSSNLFQQTLSTSLPHPLAGNLFTGQDTSPSNPVNHSGDHTATGSEITLPNPNYSNSFSLPQRPGPTANQTHLFPAPDAALHNQSRASFILAPGSGVTDVKTQVQSDTFFVKQEPNLDHRLQEIDLEVKENTVGNWCTPPARDAPSFNEQDTNQNTEGLTRFERMVLRSLSEIKKDIRKLYSVSSLGRTVVNSLELPVDLPLKNKDDFLLINGWLTENENRNKLVNELKLIGGETKDIVVRNILSRLIGPVLNELMNFTGKFQKIKLKGTEIHKVILETSRCSPLAKESTEAEIKKIICGWLNGAKDRDGGRDRRRNNEVQQNREEEGASTV